MVLSNETLENPELQQLADGSAMVAGQNVCSTLYVDTIKAMGESIGIANIQDEAAKELAECVSHRLKVIMQDAMTFMIKSKRTKLSTQDMDLSLKSKNVEPIYGFVAKDLLPFRFTSGGGRELHFLEDKEVDIQKLLSAPVPKVPLDVSLRTHWLAIEGIQPAVPENPPPQSKDQQRMDSIDPAAKLNKGARAAGSGHFTPAVGKPIKYKTNEQVFIKQLATHELSVEQQLYYKEITEACVGSDEQKRTEALQSLSNDPGLYEMLPRLCTFIAEGVRVNVVQLNLALLIYLMRMVKGLLDNPTLYLEKYLHELIPSVVTCIVSKQLCFRPEVDNHWALRDFASRLMATVCKNYNTSVNNIQVRMTKLFSEALSCDKTPLSSVYGTIVGLSELGNEVIKTFIVPKLRTISNRVEFCLDGVGHSTADRKAAQKIKALVEKQLAPVIKSMRQPPDNIEEYKAEYGYLGTSLHSGICLLRSQENKTAGSKVKVATPQISPSEMSWNTPSTSNSSNTIPPK